jgi:hypothetical protein
MPGLFRLSREIYVPQLENGSLHYIIMEIVAASDADSGWAVKDMPIQLYPAVTGPSAVGFNASDGIGSLRNSEGGLQVQ